jgi:hypothetical protein
LPVTGSGSTVNWGEQQTDSDVDLMNSVRAAFGTVTQTGTMRVALLALDHPDVPALPFSTAAGVWEITTPDGLAFDSVDLTFRYDESLFAGKDENGLMVLQNNGSGWAVLSATVDAVNHRITAHNVSSFSQFAVAIPEPGTLATLALTMLCALRRRHV